MKAISLFPGMATTNGAALAYLFYSDNCVWPATIIFSPVFTIFPFLLCFVLLLSVPGSPSYLRRIKSINCYLCVSVQKVESRVRCTKNLSLVPKPKVAAAACPKTEGRSQPLSIFYIINKASAGRVLAIPSNGFIRLSGLMLVRSCATELL